jgi:error-prone DNA polymerase
MGSTWGMQGPTTWSELEARLSGRKPQSSQSSSPPVVQPARNPLVAPEPDRTPTGGTPRPVVPYAELHCHSNFSFLDGASHPEELAE